MSKRNRLHRSQRSPRVERLESRYAMDASFTTAKFDFGTPSSPLESGYTRVTHSTVFTPAAGYGWSAGAISSFDRATGTALTRDFNYMPDGTFSVNVPNGRYQVKAILGDLGSYAHDQVGVYIEGTLKDTVSTAARQIVNRSYEVDVADQQLTFRLRDLGGSDRNAVIEALELNLLTPTLSVRDATVTEGNSGTRNLAFNVLLSNPSPTSVQFAYATRNGTAVAGGDYLTAQGTLTIPSGTTTVKVNVAIVGDQVVEPDESFTLVLSNAIGAIITDGTATGTITNNDIPIGLTLEMPAGPFAENRTTPVNATIRRNGDITAALVVSLASSDRTEARVPTTVTIPAGQLTTTFAIQIVDDTVIDGTKSVVISASSLGYVSSSATIQVTDNEQPPFFRVFDFSTTSSALVGNFARVSQASTFSAAVGYGFSAGTVLSADRGGNSLTSDFIYTNDATFAVNLPNDRYTVDLIMGDLGNFAHDQMGVFLEGVQAGVVSTGRGQIVSRTFNTQVSDGQLTLRFQDLGGSDAYAVVQGVRIYAAGTQPSSRVYWPTQPGIPNAIFSERTVNSDGFYSYSVSSSYQRSSNTIRVMLPSTYDPTKEYRVVYVLPVEAGNGRQFGDGLLTARAHNLQNVHDAIFVAPTFSDIPWYADNATNRSIWQETYFRDVVVPFVETQYKTVPGANGRYLLGFSKSGYGAVAMLLRNPETFGKVIAWDSPLAMTNPSSGFGFSGIVGTTQNFTDNYQILNLLQTRGSALMGQPPRIFLLGYATTYGTFRDHQIADARMTALGIPHVYDPGVLRSHVWNSGWMPDAARMLLS